LPKDVERLDQRHAGLEQCRQLLIEDEQFLAPYLPAASTRQSKGGQHAAALERKDKQPLFLELAAKVCFGVGDVNTFDNLAAGGAEPTTEFHKERAGFPHLDLEVSRVAGPSDQLRLRIRRIRVT